MSTLVRYLLFQIPGWVVAAAVLTFLWEVELLSGRVAGLLWIAWLVKDAVTYPLVRSSYEASAHRHGPAKLVGAQATVTRALEPDGYVRVRGELWRAHAAEPVPVGTVVEVVGARRWVLVVRVRGESSSTDDAPA